MRSGNLAWNLFRQVGIGDRVHEVAADDVLYIPAGAPHFYEVIEAPFEFLCMVPNDEDRPADPLRRHLPTPRPRRDATAS